MEMKRKTLHVLTGLPQSGKSTWAMGQGLPIVNPEHIKRYLGEKGFGAKFSPIMWTFSRYMVETLFASGHESVVLDACNVTEAHREVWLDPAWDVVLVLVPTGTEVCLRRAIENGRDDLLDDIRRLSKKFDPVNMEKWRVDVAEEGFWGEGMSYREVDMALASFSFMPLDFDQLGRARDSFKPKGEG